MDPLPIYPVETFPDRPANIVPSLGVTADWDQAVDSVESAGFRIREDLEPVWTDRAGAQGWYIFVEGREQPTEYGLSGSKKSKKKRKKREAEAKATAKERKSAKESRVARPRRLKRGTGSGKKFNSQGFNLKKLPLAVATQLLFGQIWPEAYSVPQNYPKPAFYEDDPAWLRDMDYNPHLFMNVDDVMGVAIEGQGGDVWNEMARDCYYGNEAPYVAIVSFGISPYYADGKSIERQIMETFDFPVEAHQVLVRRERADDREDYQEEDDASQELWETYLRPYFYHLSTVLDRMKPPELKGYFNFTVPDGMEDWGLVYEECTEPTAEEKAKYEAERQAEHQQYEAERQARIQARKAQGLPPEEDDEDDVDDEDDLDEPEGGDLNEP